MTVKTLIAGLLVGFLEIKRSSRLSPELNARGFGVPMLGVLPVMAGAGGKAAEGPWGAGERSRIRHGS